MTDKEWERKQYAEKWKPAYDAWIVHYPFTTENLDGEIWLPIPYCNDYHMSTFGRVKSCKFGKEKILKPSLTAQGYLQINLCKNNKRKHFRIHVLVGKLFIPNPENKPEVDHRFGMKLDCSVWNLRWATPAENNNYAVETGLIKLGEDRVDTKLTNEQVQYIRENPDGLMGKKLAEIFNVCPQTISNIQRGKRYQNAGGVIREKLPNHLRTPDEERAQILARYQAGGISQRELAKEFGVCQKTVCNIVNGKS